jgi:hypothetical protein
MRWIARILFCSIACACFSSGAIGEPTQEDLNRNARMNQCIKLLQPQDKGLRNHWRRHCSEDEVDDELGTPAEPMSVQSFADAVNVDAIEDSDCDSPLPYTPVAETRACGLGTKTLLTNLSERAVIRIKLPGNKCARFIPLLLTNKTDFACNAVQTRIACVDANYDRARDITSLTLSTRRGGTPDFTKVSITRSDVQRTNRPLTDIVSHPQFVLLPVKVGRTENIIKAIAEKLDSTRNACRKSGRSRQKCDNRSIAKADAFMQEWERRYRNPRRDSPKAAMLADARSLVKYLRDNGVDKKIEHWLLFLSIAQNEVGLNLSPSEVVDPIYGLSDAVDGNSGLSFGAHQIDIGANSGDEVKLFWDVMAVFLANHSDRSLAAASSMKPCVNLPLRLMTVRALSLAYSAAPSMTQALRSQEGVAKYNRRLLNYLDEQVQKTNALPGLFGKSMIARTLYTDVENQSGRASRVQSLVRDIVPMHKKLSLCRNVVEAEDKLLAAMIWKNPHDHSQGKTAYSERYENISKIIRDKAHKGGVTDCE